VGLKWPNDVMVAGRKVAGVLASLTREGDVVVGIGLNVHQSESELPEPQAGSLAVLGAPNVDRTWLTIAVLSAAASGYERWARGDPRLREEIAGRMITLGVPAAVRQADGTVLSGEAVGIGPDGALELILPDGTRHHVYAGELLEDDWRRAREARLAAPEL
jgi:BirA family biotin operon repressor/biotin-[acetyl-CoA-carboxylase] ligase